MYRDRSVLALLALTIASSVGVFAQFTALGKQLYDMTGRDLDLGLLGLAEFAPAILLVLVTGAVADRIDRRFVASVSLAVEAACAVALALYARTDPTATWPIFVIAVMFGVGRAFAAPSSRSLPANIVSEEDLPRLMATYSGCWQVAFILGPIVGGFAYAVDPSVPFWIAAALALVSAVLVLAIKLRPAQPRVTELAAAAVADTAPAGRLGTALDGMKFILATPIVLAAISLDLFAVLFGGARALLPVIADEQLGVGSVGLGWLAAAGGIGAVIVAAVLARRPLQRRLGRILLMSVGVFGLATIVLGVTHSYAVAFVAMAVLSGADMVSVFIRGTLVPLVTPDEVRGRVLAAENVFIGASNELGAFESGVAGELIGTTGAVVGGGVGTLIVVAVWWKRFPVLRDVDRFSDVATNSASPAAH